MMNEKMKVKHPGGKQVLCRILAALAVLALLVGIVLPGLGEEAEKPAAIPELPEHFKEWVEVPELTDRLVPLDLSCEKDGIRLEVTWGAATDIGALFIYTMQDLQGARFEPNTAMRLDMLPVDDWFSGFTVLDVNNNRKFTMAAFYSYESPETVTKDNVMTLGVRALDIHEEKHLDIRAVRSDHTLHRNRAASEQIGRGDYRRHVRRNYESGGVRQQWIGGKSRKQQESRCSCSA